MRKIVILGLLWGRALLAADCEVGAAPPQAATAVYGLQAGVPIAVNFKPDSRGTIHALDRSSSSELWTFTPTSLDTSRPGGVIGDVRVLHFDADRDNVIEPADGDRVWLYFGIRRGGRDYYALDVSDRLNPRLLWRIGPTELPGVGETWSTPTIARIRIASAAQNGERLVLVLGGGYDESKSTGQRIFIVDAESGQLLWYAGNGGAGSPDLLLPQMTAPIAARVAVIDTDGDQFADRMYAADLGGRVWRFDIWNGRDRASLVTGGVVAALAGSLPEDARQFFSAPDVALIQRPGATPFFSLGIGSGNRADPRDREVHDRFYAVRDLESLSRFTQSEYDALVPITDSDLLDITGASGSAAIQPYAPGWKLELRLKGGWSGEKVLAEALTLNGVLLVTTYRPLSEDTCTGESTLYALSVNQGRATFDLNDDGQIGSDDISTALEYPGIPGEIELFVEPNQLPGSTLPAAIQCRVGEQTLPKCAIDQRPLRTFWHRQEAD